MIPISFKNVYPDMGIYDTTDLTIPDPDEQEALFETDVTAGPPGTDAGSKDLLLGMLIVVGFLVLLNVAK